MLRECFSNTSIMWSLLILKVTLWPLLPALFLEDSFSHNSDLCYIYAMTYWASTVSNLTNRGFSFVFFLQTKKISILHFLPECNVHMTVKTVLSPRTGLSYKATETELYKHKACCCLSVTYFLIYGLCQFVLNCLCHKCPHTIVSVP